MNLLKKYIINTERKKVDEILAEQADYIYDLPCKTNFISDRTIRTYQPLNEDIEIKGFIIDIHGGGLIAGTAMQNNAFCRWCANSGYKVFNIDYPLIPEVTFIEQIQFIANAIKTISEIEPDWNKVGKSKFLFGDSAGALLATVILGLTSPTRGQVIRADFDIAAIDVEWDGVWLQSPMLYTTQFDAIGLIMSKIYYEKGWKKKPYAKYIKDPIWYLIHDYSDIVVFSTSFKDELNTQTAKALNEMYEYRNLYPKCFFSDNEEHDANILFPDLDDSEQINESAFVLLENYFNGKMLGKK